MPKKGTEYELFVKDVYECLNRADGLTDAQIQHDVKLTGAAGVEHQIDVFWTFKRGGVEYKVAVECKDYKNHVSKDKIIAFHGILQDIGNIHGIFASRAGFQSGAAQYAAKYGIQLMEIRRPEEKDWEGRIKDIHLIFHIRTVGKVRPHIILNQARAEKMGLALPDRNGFHAFADEVSVRYEKMSAGDKASDEPGGKTMLDLINSLPRETLGENSFTYTFCDGMIRLEGDEYPVDAIEFKYDICESTEQTVIYGENSIKAIVKNITDGTESHVDRFGQVEARK